jgi:hypothetical protein
VSNAAGSLQPQPPSPLTTPQKSAFSSHRNESPNPRLDTDRQKAPTGKP